MDEQFEKLGGAKTFEAALPRLREIIVDAWKFAVDNQEDAQEGEQIVDVGFFYAAIDKTKALAARGELKHILGMYPGAMYRDLLPSLEAGPSYIHVGAALDSQETALLLFAVGEAAELWRVVTPKRLFGNAISDEQAQELIGGGLVLIDGFAREET